MLVYSLMKKSVILLLIILLIPAVLALSSQQWINTYQLQQTAQVGNNLKFEVYDKTGKIVNRDPEVGDSFTLGASDDFVWNKAYVYPDTPLGFVHDFDLNIKQVAHTVLVIPGKRRGLFTRGRQAVYATYYTDEGISNRVDTSSWTPQDYHLAVYTCKTRGTVQWQNTGLFDCFWNIHTFTLKGKAVPPGMTIGWNLEAVSVKVSGAQFYQGDTFYVDMIAKNIGVDHSPDVLLRYFLIPTQGFDVLIGASTLPQTKSGQSSLLAKSLAIPRNINPGDYEVKVVIDPDQKKGDTDYSNNDGFGGKITVDTKTVCGNNICEQGETAQTCAVDCKIGPLPSKNVPNCATPTQPQQSIWKVDQDTTLCPGSYKLPLGVEISKSITFDCNDAEIEGNIYSSDEQFHIFSDNVELKNCNFKSMLITTDSIVQGQAGALVSGPTRSGVKIHNNNFKSYAYIIGSIANGEVRKNYIPAFQLYNGAENNEVSENKGVVLARLNSRASNNKIHDNDIDQLELFYYTENNLIKDNNLRLLTLGWMLPFTGAVNNGVSFNKIEVVRLREGSNNNDIAFNHLNQIVLEKASSNLIGKNIIKGTQSQQASALMILNGGGKNEISYNTLDGDNLGIIGIGLDNSNENKIGGNNIENNEVGVVVLAPSRQNDFFRNNFMNNRVMHVQDATTFNTHEKNYYEGFSNDPAQCPDVNGDDLCDNPFIIMPSPAPNYGAVEDKFPSKVKN